MLYANAIVIEPEPVPASITFLPGPIPIVTRMKPMSLGYKDLCAARQIVQYLSQRGLQQKVRRTHVTEDLRSPRLADQVVMLQDAAMGFKSRSCLERDDKVFVTQADQLGKVTCACIG